MTGSNSGARAAPADNQGAGVESELGSLMSADDKGGEN